MYDYRLHQKVISLVPEQMELGGKDNDFYSRLITNISAIEQLYQELYRDHPRSAPAFDQLINTLVNGYISRPAGLREKDHGKLEQRNWFLSNKINGMSLYIDRFAGSLKNLGEKLYYFDNLGVNLLHLMPFFDSPAEAGDGGYAVSNFRKVDSKFGSLHDLQMLRHEMDNRNMFLMMDIVLNHTSDQHEWAMRAKKGEKAYQDYYYFFEDRRLPDLYEYTMPEIFPEAAPGNFSFIPECNQWVMTVFHNYQWDLNYTNPDVLISMLDNILFYANLGVDILRIDAPAFIWKKLQTTSQNLPEAHTLLRIIKQCVQVVAPGMAILGEAIVAPAEIMKYFGTGEYTARECDFAYNATQMALQWDALATSKTAIMFSAQEQLSKKPAGTSWISYTRSHDDIGFGFGDDLIYRSGFNVFHHRKFLMDYFSGIYHGSYSRGALFSSNPKTNDARISGTLASLCGMQEAKEDGDAEKIKLAVSRILLMQAMSFFTGGIPMIFSGDELGMTNDYTFRDDPAKSYDNRWMHRPVMDWKIADKMLKAETPEAFIFTGTRALLALRKELAVLTDLSNIEWVYTENIHIAGFIRRLHHELLFCFFNFSAADMHLSWRVINQYLPKKTILFDCWTKEQVKPGKNNESLLFKPYQFYFLSPLSA